MNNADQRAFPFTYNSEVNVEPGLTKREYFAVMAMQGMIAHHGISLNPIGINDCIDAADDLLAALSKPAATIKEESK